MDPLYLLHNSSLLFVAAASYDFFVSLSRLGHDDRGAISDYVVIKVPQLLRHGMDSSFSASHDDWTSLCTTACSTVDLELKKSGWQGGAAAIFCLVTKDQIVVGNVGDSRCILVEHKPTTSTTTTSDNVGDEGKGSAVLAAAAGQESGDSSVENLAESMNQQLSLSGTDGSPAMASPPSESPLLAVTTGGGAMTVVAAALSEDHKANLPEERARIEKAGLEVIEVKYQDQHGNEASRFKVQLNEGNNVDFSRSLGDHDYKSIKDEKTKKFLANHEQPIVCIPDVRVIDRHAIAPESYLVLACDGVWDVKSNDDVAKFVTENIHRRLAENAATGDDEDILSNVGDDLLKACIDSNDNLSTIIVALSQAADPIVASSQRLLQRYSNSAMKTPPSPVINSAAFTTPQK
jgi:serine/threonine protein phosphatase PrpC